MRSQCQDSKEVVYFLGKNFRSVRAFHGNRPLHKHRNLVNFLLAVLPREDLVSHIRNLVSGIVPTPEEPAGKEKESEKIKRWVSESRKRWEDLLQEKLLAEHPSRYQYGIWTFAYSIIGNLAVPNLSELESMLKKVVGRETGWPAWWVPDLSYTVEPPYPLNGTL